MFVLWYIYFGSFLFNFFGIVNTLGSGTKFEFVKFEFNIFIFEFICLEDMGVFYYDCCISSWFLVPGWIKAK